LPSEARTGAKKQAAIQELHSPKAKKHMVNGLAPPQLDIKRPITPELIPDSMASRIPENGVRS